MKRMGLGTDWAQKCCGKISLHGHRGFFMRGTEKGDGVQKGLGTALAQACHEFMKILGTESLLAGDRY